MDVQQETNLLVEKFEYACKGLFAVTSRSTVTFEQGVYGCLVAKPTKRMKSALSIDRELFVVASTFNDQQQRTIKFLRQQIENSKGRFEPTVAIVLHNDSEGSAKLKVWGRDKGIAILALYGGGNLQNAQVLERSLCYELYSHDPFDVTGPVSDDANFYGRRDEALDLARKLQRGAIRSCLGVRKVGKTSIINRVLREIRQSYEAACLIVDCSRDEVWQLTAAQLLDSIALTAEELLTADSRYQNLRASTATNSLSTAIKRLELVLSRFSRPVVLVFDEIDYITPGSSTNAHWRTEFNPFWRNLRAIYQECTRQEKTLSILLGGVSALWFTVESIEGSENAALHFVPEEYLSPMALEATIAMIRKLGRVAGLQFEPEIAEHIARSTANMPYWARKCCSYIHRHLPINERPRPISIQHASSLVASFVQEEGSAIAEVAMRHLFRVHPTLEDAAAKCHKGESSVVQENLKRSLRRYGILTQGNALSGQMISAAFEALAVPAQVPTEADPKTPLALPRYDEWAEELAAIGKRRNILERRLRELTINFLRFDSMQGGKLATFRERVIAILPEKQRESLKHVSADDAIAKFNWTDLVKLIVKEWALFAQLLGDKGEFEQNCQIINDRFDAHAKAADSADFALYRRALGRVEERIAKIQ
ncbi:ATP-binding protein [Roseimicrobium sp. ORNL1]|uniref:ATP-binding protein n=1 Tax=Roseimicrobium sp. ORNL1 TaxID=2711231 RepID=UPI0013E19603|nr:ATP-binding protein [Roseimicrobium sp. ORNL1]QIF05618.1 ATP-binding protein [Roseimicrobium sp. ORNL1]